MISMEEQKIEISQEQINSWKPLICLPCYDRQMTEPFVMSLVQTCMFFKEIGLQFGISTISDSLISRARNQLIAKFMANSAFTHVLFIDVDLAFNHEDILKMLWHDKDIVTGAYPIKEINWKKVISLANSGCDYESIARKSTRFVVNAAREGSGLVQVENGAIKIHDAGTGFMLIKREAFVKLFEAYPELKYKDDTGTIKDEEGNYTYALFNSYVDEDGRFLSEDYGFGRYWQRIGGEVWVDPSIELMHLGRFEYRGKMTEWLMENASEVLPAQE